MCQLPVEFELAAYRRRHIVKEVQSCIEGGTVHVLCIRMAQPTSYDIQVMQQGLLGFDLHILQGCVRESPVMCPEDRYLVMFGKSRVFIIRAPEYEPVLLIKNVPADVILGNHIFIGIAMSSHAVKQPAWNGALIVFFVGYRLALANLPAANFRSIQVLDARLPGALNMRLLTSLRLFSRLVAKKNNPALKCSCRGKFQVQLVLDAFEYRRATTQDNGVHYFL